MKTNLKWLGLSALSMLLLASCGGGGSRSSTTPQPGVLESGGAGVPIGQVDNGTGTPVTANFSTALAINDNRKVIGFAEVVAGSPFAAALWTVDAAGGSVAPTALNPLTPGSFASAFAIDAAGSPVGQADDGTRLVAVIWKNAGAPTVLPQLAATGDYAAYAISSDGSLVTGQAVDALGSTRSVIWTADSLGVFGNPSVLPVNIFTTGGGSSPFSTGNSVARVGTDEILVVGEAEDGDGTTHAALWRSVNGGALYAPTDLGANQTASAVNLHRVVVGEAVAGLAPQYWLVDATGVAAPPVALASTGGSAMAVNANDRIAGWSGAVGQATLWNGATPTSLFGTASQAYSLNNELQPLVVGRNGSLGFVKRGN